MYGLGEMTMRSVQLLTSSWENEILFPAEDGISPSLPDRF
jgi:hypothetical protein